MNVIHLIGIISLFIPLLVTSDEPRGKWRVDEVMRRRTKSIGLSPAREKSKYHSVS